MLTLSPLYICVFVVDNITVNPIYILVLTYFNIRDNNS